MRLRQVALAVAFLLALAGSSFGATYNYNVSASGCPNTALSTTIGWDVSKTSGTAIIIPACTLTIPSPTVSGMVGVTIHTIAAVVAPYVIVNGVTYTSPVTNAFGAVASAATYPFCVATGTLTGAIAVSAGWTSPSTTGTISVYSQDGADQVNPCGGGNNEHGFNLVTGGATAIVVAPTGGLGIDFITEGSGGAMPFPGSSQTYISFGVPNVSVGGSYANSNGATTTFSWGTGIGWTYHSVYYINPCGGCTVGYSHPETIMLCHGDSIMMGWRQATTPPGYFDPYYPTGPSGDTQSDIITRLHALNSNYVGYNFGFAGAVMTFIAGNELDHALRLGVHPKYGCTEGGINDVSHTPTPIPFSATNYDTIKAKFDAMGTQMIVEELWPAQLDPPPSTGTLAYNVSLNSWAAIQTPTPVTVLPMHTLMADPLNALKMNPLWTGDGTHPNATGVGVHATIIAGALAGPATTTVETRADGAGISVPTQSVASGGSVTGYAISRDSFGNFLSNVAAVWSLTTKTGGVADSDLVAAGDSKSATFTGHAAGTGVITAVANTFTGNSGTLSVGTPSAVGSGIMRAHP